MSKEGDSVWSSYPERVKKVTYAYKDCIVPSFTDKSYLEDLANFEVRNDDIFVISYPKSGNTWTQFIVCKILKNYHNMDNQHIFDKVPFIEFPQRHLQMQTENTVPGMYEVAKNQPSPRVLKTHLQSPLLPDDIATKKPKIVYVARNPKDNAVSYYNFSKVSPSLPKYDKWSDFFSDYCQGAGKYLIALLWLISGIDNNSLRHEENVMFLKYEDMKKDLRGCVIRIADFLGYYLSSEVIEDIADQSSFAEMKTNPKANPDHLATVKYRNQKGKTFMRKGVVGDWKNYFTVNQNNHFDSLYAKRMEGTNLTFDFTL
ncbi:Sulfotransferase 1A1 [Holothuria leucospilota]|uniref:Sulfotransferase 1A1 n=1 Tax=Holothuria leucospilota TaxID=206669 RepID=A0A9Q0YPP7_HOLLE|nr:Sulfotransferase 1A1 [Holothuria leucospilota]